MERRNILAIDFGTTNTYFSKCPADQISPVGVDFGTGRDGLPTAILYRGDREPLVGEPALHEFGEATPEERKSLRLRTQFKPDIVDSEEAARAASDFLQTVVSQAQRQHIALDPTKHDVIFGVPSEAGAPFRSRLSQIAQTAGYGDVRLIDEPMGALLYHLWRKDFSPEEAQHGILVIDFGGGTCDFAFLQGLEVTHSWGDMALGGRLFDDLFFQWFVDQNPGAIADMEKAGDTYYVHSYLCREVKEFFSLTMARDRTEKVSKSVGRYGSLRSMDWPAFLERARRYAMSPTFVRHMEDMGLRTARTSESAARTLRSPVDLIDWFRTTLAHGLAEKAIDVRAISRVILAGGSSQWPFVYDVVTEALGVEQSRLMRSDRPYAVIAQGLSILPALQEKFGKTREQLRNDLPDFCRMQVRPLVEKVTASYVAGVADDVTVEVFDKIIRPILEKFRQDGGSVKNLRDSISAQIQANETRLRDIIENRMRTLRLGLPGQLDERLRNWFASYGLSVGENVLDAAQRKSAGAEHLQPGTPDLYGSIMDIVSWFVIGLAATTGAAILGGGGIHLLAAGPIGLVAGAIISAIVAFLAVRYGTARARQLADTWNAPPWVLKTVLWPSRITGMRKDFRQRVEDMLHRETAAWQDELESKIRDVTGKQIDGLSEIVQL
jgi:molecular chaperone DnaK